MLLRTCSRYQQLTQTPSEPSLAKYWGEQVPVHHVETFYKYIDAEYAKVNAKLKRGKEKSNATVTFPGN